MASEANASGPHSSFVTSRGSGISCETVSGSSVAAISETRPRFRRIQSRLPETLLAEIARRLMLRRDGDDQQKKQHSVRAISRETGVDRETVRAIDRNGYRTPQA